MSLQYELKELTSEVQSIVRSGTAITSLAQCVDELVLNSIDAGGSNFFVSINPDDFNVRVDDDGHGLHELDLKEVGNRYTTSKCSGLNDLAKLKYYGFRGEALASIIAVSNTVEIIARPHDLIGVEFRKKYKNGVAAGFVEKHNTAKKQSGVTVIVNKLLSKLPVRQNRIDKCIQIEEVKSVLEKIALLNPKINIELRNEKTGTRIFKYVSSCSYADSFNQMFESRIGCTIKFIDEHFLFKRLFFTLLVASDFYYKKNDYQYVFLNGRFIKRGRIHKWVGRGVLGKSDSNNSGKNEKFPVFILNVTCPFSEYDITIDPKKETVQFQDWTAFQNGIDGLMSKLNIGSVSIVSKNAETIHKTTCAPGGSYDIKNAFHSRTVFRNREMEQEFKSISAGSSASRSGSSTPRDNSFNRNRSLTRSYQCSHVVDVRATRRKRPSKNGTKNSGNSFHEKKKPKLTEEAFKKFPDWNEAFHSDKTPSEPLVIQNLPKQKKSSLPLDFTVTSSKNKSPTLEWKVNRFLNTIPKHVSEAATRDETEDQCEKKDVVTNIHVINEEEKSLQYVTPPRPPAEKEHSQGSFLYKPDLKQAILSHTECFLESFLEEKHKYANNKQAIVNRICKYFSYVKKGKKVFDTKSTFFKTRGPAPINKDQDTNSTKFKAPMISQASKKQVAILPEVVSNQIKQGNFVPPLLNLLPAQKTYSAEWNDKMLFGNDNDSSLFPADWSVEIVTDKSNQEWLQTVDKSGKTLYINLRTGDSSYDMTSGIENFRNVTVEEMKQTNPMRFSWLKKQFPSSFRKFCRNKPREITKDGDLNKIENSCIGMSLLKCLSADEITTTSKWHEDELTRISTHFDTTVNTTNCPSSSRFNFLDNKCMKKLDGVMNSFKFSKEDLENVTIISQLEQKFIVARLLKKEPQFEVLVLFDQHAVHERIRLEKFIEEAYIESKKVGKYLLSMEVMPPYQLSLSEHEVNIMDNYVDSFEQIGIKFQKISSTTVKVKTAPKCFCEKSAIEPISMREETLRSLIRKLIDDRIRSIWDTKCAKMVGMPKTVFDVLCSQACHGAIKFGDELDLETCQQLISDLKKCKTPFQCAHGRPSVFPLMNIHEYKMNTIINLTHRCRELAIKSSRNLPVHRNHDQCSKYFCNDADVDESSGYFSVVNETIRKPQNERITQNEINSNLPFSNFNRYPISNQNDIAYEASPYFFKGSS